jgi:hypothetical protein
MVGDVEVEIPITLAALNNVSSKMKEFEDKEMVRQVRQLKEREEGVQTRTIEEPSTRILAAYLALVRPETRSGLTTLFNRAPQFRGFLKAAPLVAPTPINGSDENDDVDDDWTREMNMMMDQYDRGADELVYQQQAVPSPLILDESPSEESMEEFDGVSSATSTSMELEINPEEEGGSSHKNAHLHESRGSVGKRRCYSRSFDDDDEEDELNVEDVSIGLETGEGFEE